MKSLGSIGSLLVAPALVLLALICTGNSVKQELWLYDAQDDAIQFHSKAADISDHSLFLAKVVKICTTGYATNFQTTSSSVGSVSSTGIVCYNFTIAATVRSLRHWGANDSNTDALSLYGVNWEGKEVLVTAQAHTGITDQTHYIAIAGASDWMLFEGQELDGKSACYKLPSGYYMYANSVQSFNLTTIGSVFKGCDVQEIEHFKILQDTSHRV